MAAIKAQGTALKFKPASGSQLTVGRLTSVGEIQPDSEDMDVTTLESLDGYREYMQGLRDSGELELSGYHDAGDDGQKALRSAYASGRVGDFEVVFPDGTRVVFSGYVKSHIIGAAEVDGAVGFGAVVRITGPVMVAEAD